MNELYQQTKNEQSLLSDCSTLNQNREEQQFPYRDLLNAGYLRQIFVAVRYLGKISHLENGLCSDWLYFADL